MIFLVNHFWAALMDIWQFFSGHTGIEQLTFDFYDAGSVH